MHILHSLKLELIKIGITSLSCNIPRISFMASIAIDCILAIIAIWHTISTCSRIWISSNCTWCIARLILSPWVYNYCQIIKASSTLIRSCACLTKIDTQWAAQVSYIIIFSLLITNWKAISSMKRTFIPRWASYTLSRICANNTIRHARQATLVLCVIVLVKRAKSSTYFWGLVSDCSDLTLFATGSTIT